MICVFIWSVPEIVIPAQAQLTFFVTRFLEQPAIKIGHRRKRQQHLPLKKESRGLLLCFVSARTLPQVFAKNVFAKKQAYCSGASLPAQLVMAVVPVLRTTAS